VDITTALGNLASATTTFNNALQSHVVNVDTTALNTAIGNLQTWLDDVTTIADNAADVPQGTKYLTNAQKTALQGIINAAIAVRDSAIRTGAQVTDQAGFIATADTTYTGYYNSQVGTKTDITTIANASISGLTAPVTGAAPDTAITAGDTAKYTVQSITWKQGGSTHTGPFAAGTAYTADIVLQAAAGYKFTAITPGTDTGTPAAGTIDTDAAQNTLTFTVTFPATDSQLDITIGLNKGEVTVTGPGGPINTVSGASAFTLNKDGADITLTAVGFTGGSWYLDGGTTAIETGNSITLSATDSALDVRQHSITFRGVNGGKPYAKQILFTVEE
jgi:hypothetical protein